MIIKRKVTTTTKEEVTIQIDNKEVSVFTDKEKEIDTLKTLAEVSEKVLNLNAESK